MALFSADNVEVEDGTATLKQGVTAGNALKTAITRPLTEETDSIDLDGAAIFTGLQSGTYYVAEVDAPEGYAVNGMLAKVVVDDTGVYADAGAEGDGVTVTRGVGRIVRSMIQFATDDEIDATLHNIEATPQLGTQESDGALNWKDNEKASVQHLQYDDDGNSVLDYALQKESEAYTVDEGMPRMTVKQCSIHQSDPRQEVSSYDLTNLFTGVTIVRIADEQVGGLDVMKQVSGEGADANAEFSFTVTFTHAATDGGDATPLTQDEVDASGMQLAVDTGDAGNVTVGDNGEVTFTLKGGETAHLTNVPAGVSYKVVENTASGYETSYDDKESGTIEFNETMSTTVTNTWHSSVTLTGDNALKVQKTVTGASTDVDFTFEATFDADASAAAETPGRIAGIQGATEGQNFTLAATVSDNFAEGDAAKTASFGDVTFTQPGTYIFNVKETNGAPAEGSGWTYDGTIKTITVVVTDNSEGALVADVVTYDNDVEGAAEADKTVNNAAAFTNSYEAAPVTIGEGDVATGRKATASSSR